MGAWVQRQAADESDRRFRSRLVKLCVLLGGTATSAVCAVLLVPQLLQYGL